MVLPLLFGTFTLLSIWAAFRDVPFTVINNAHHPVARLAGILQLTSMVYTISDVYQRVQRIAKPPAQKLPRAQPEPESESETELDYILSVLKTEYKQNRPVILAIPPATRADYFTPPPEPTAATVAPEETAQSHEHVPLTLSTFGDYYHQYEGRASIDAILGLILMTVVLYTFIGRKLNVSLEIPGVSTVGNIFRVFTENLQNSIKDAVANLEKSISEVKDIQHEISVLRDNWQLELAGRSDPAIVENLTAEQRQLNETLKKILSRLHSVEQIQTELNRSSVDERADVSSALVGDLASRVETMGESTNQFRQELSKLVKGQEGLVQKVDGLKGDFKNLHATATNVDTKFSGRIKEEVEKQGSNIEALQEELARHRTAVDVMKSESTGQFQELSTLVEEQRKFVQKVDGLESDFDKFHTAITEANTKSFGHIKEELKSQESNIKDLREEVTRYRTTVDMISKSTNECRQELSTLAKKQEERLVQNFNNLESNFKKLHASTKNTETKLSESFKKELQKQESNSKGLQEELTRHRSRLNTVTSEFADKLRHEVSTFVEGREMKMIGKIVDLEHDFGKLYASNEETKLSVDHLADEFDTLHKHVQDISDDMKDLASTAISENLIKEASEDPETASLRESEGDFIAEEEGLPKAEIEGVVVATETPSLPPVVPGQPASVAPAGDSDEPIFDDAERPGKVASDEKSKKEAGGEKSRETLDAVHDEKSEGTTSHPPQAEDLAPPVASDKKSEKEADSERSGQEVDSENPREAADELTSSALKGGLGESKWSDEEYEPNPNTRTRAQDREEVRAKLLYLE